MNQAGLANRTRGPRSAALGKPKLPRITSDTARERNDREKSLCTKNGSVWQ